MSFAAFVRLVVGRIPLDKQRVVRIQRHPGVWEELPECPACDGTGVCENEYAVPNPCSGSGYLVGALGECPVCEGRQYVEIEDDEV